jgi:hypothetical protein
MKPSDDEAQIVPFGKYRDQSIESFLTDRGYAEWVMNQPGLVAMLQAKYPVFYNMITIGATASDDTPEHNKLQAMFLNRDFQYAFIEAALGKSVYAVAQESADRADKIHEAALAEALEHAAELIKRRQKEKARSEESLQEAQTTAAKSFSEWEQEYEAKADEIERKYREGMRSGQNLWGSNHPESVRTRELESLVCYKPETRIKEAQEWLICRKDRFAKACEEIADEETHFAELKAQQANHKNALPVRPSVQVEFECGFDVKLIATWKTFGPEIRCRIELKPLMGDDFPSVLRQMKRNGADTLVVGEFESKSCTLSQVRGMFGAEKRIITLAEIQSIQARGGWPDDNDATADRTRS